MRGFNVASHQHFYKQTRKVMKNPILVILVVLFLFPTSAHASCHTHKCWHRVHLARAEHSVEKKISRITPYRCWTITGVFRSAVSCWIIEQESATVRSGPWNALNTWVSGTPCGSRACGPYQFVGKAVPWPVIVESRYETLKRKLAHHRMARTLPASAWVG